MTNRGSLRLVTFVASGAMLAAIAAFGWLGTYSRLSCDDYYFALPSAQSAWSMAWRVYHEWSGCYADIVFDRLILPIGPNIVRVLPAAALALWLLALLALFRGLLPNRTWEASWLAAFVTLWATVDSTVSASQSLYWAQGMIKYSAGLIVLTVAAAWMIAQTRTEKFSGASGCALTALLLFMGGGFSETAMVVQVTAALIALLLPSVGVAVGGRSVHRILLVGFAAGVAAAMAVSLAPGNFARQNAIGSHPTIVAAAGLALWYTLLFTVRFLVWKSLTAACVFASGWMLANSKPFGSATMETAVLRRRTGICFLSTVALLTVSFLPAAYTLGTFLPSRALIVPQFILVLAVFAGGWSWAAIMNAAPPGTLAVRCFQLLAGTLIFVAPLWSVYQTFLSHTDVARYAHLWDRRDQYLRAAHQAGQSDVILDPLPEDLALVGGNGLGTGDVRIADFYGFRSVRYSQAVYWPAEPWTTESWTRVIVPEMLPMEVKNNLMPNAVRVAFRRIHERIRATIRW
jgi:hypothetical protein